MHPAKHDFLVVSRAPEHPIMNGLPAEWLHASDEIYSQLRGPAKNLQVLATASAEKAKGGTGEHEPMFMTIQYGKGRVFHNTLGHVGPNESAPVPRSAASATSSPSSAAPSGPRRARSRRRCRPTFRPPTQTSLRKP